MIREERDELRGACRDDEMHESQQS